MKRSLSCLRCGSSMDFYGEEQLQLGKTGWVLGDLSNLLAGALKTEIYRCPMCGKLEFFSTGTCCEKGGSDASRKSCPECGAECDQDCCQCPICGYEYGS